MPNELEMIIAIMALSPLAFVGIFKIFSFFRDLFMVKAGNVRMKFLTSNRNINKTMGKPQGDGTIKTGKNKLYEFDPSKLYREGPIPTGIWKEDGIEMLDPVDTESKGLSVGRLSELLIRWYNLGVISTQKNERLILMFVLIGMACAAGAAFFAFMNFQAAGASEGHIVSEIVNIGELIRQHFAQAAAGNATVL